jgi:hypothetical protein
MITLDTIRMQFPKDTLKTFSRNDSRILASDKYLGSDYLYTQYEQRGLKEHGINRILVDSDKVDITLSGKVLLDNYAKGISLDSIEQVFDNINKVSAFDIDSNKAIDQSHILRCDYTQNIKPNYSLKDSVESMLLMRTANNTNVDVYTKRGNVGCVIDRSIKSEKRRLIMYDKLKELMLKSSSAFLHNCKDSAKVVNSFKGVLRIEQNMTSLKTIKKQFKTIDTRLLSVLNSLEKPNYNVLKKVIDDSKQLAIFNEPLFNESISNIFKRKGAEQILKECHYDLDIVAKFIDHVQRHSTKKDETIRSNTYKWTNYCKGVLQETLQRRFEQSHNVKPIDISTHILNLLKSA